MKKFTFTLVSAFILSSSLMAQRISQMTVEGQTSLVPFAAFNPKNNSTITTETGDGQIIFLPTADLSNVKVTLECGTTATITEPTTLPTNWTSTVSGIKVTNTAAPNDWALYSITAKKINPAPLPFILNTGTGNFDSNSWTKETVGWAGACIDKAQTLIRFGSAKRSFVVAFSDAPDSLIYTIKYLATPWNTGNVFDVDGSADGASWTSIMQYNATTAMPLSSPAVIAKLKINPSFRYIRWIYTTRAAGNVSLENIKVTKLIGSGILSPEEQKVKVNFGTANELQLLNPEAVSNIRLYNATGSLLLNGDKPQATLALPELSKGVYIAKITFGSGRSLSAKLIKK